MAGTAVTTTNGNAIQANGNDKQIFRRNITSIVASMADLLPRHMTPERMTKLVYAAATKTPKLMQCTTASIGMCLTTCSELGLEPGDVRGHVYLLPRNSKVKDENGRERYEMQCTLMVGYKGYAELARRSSSVLNVDACVVYEGEVFTVTRGLKPNIDHIYNLNCDRSDAKIIAAYSFVELSNGKTIFEVLTRQEIIARRNRSQSANSGPWVTDFARMARKSAIRALLTGGLVPLSSEVQGLIDVANEMDLEHEKNSVAVSAVSSLKELADRTLDRTPVDEDMDEDADITDDIEPVLASALAECTTAKLVTELQARWIAAEAKENHETIKAMCIAKIEALKEVK